MVHLLERGGSVEKMPGRRAAVSNPLWVGPSAATPAREAGRAAALQVPFSLVSAEADIAARPAPLRRAQGREGSRRRCRPHTHLMYWRGHQRRRRPLPLLLANLPNPSTSSS